MISYIYAKNGADEINKCLGKWKNFVGGRGVITIALFLLISKEVEDLESFLSILKGKFKDC